FKLVEYFKVHALRVYAAIEGQDDGGEDVRSLVRWLRRGGRTEFSERDVTQNMRRFREALQRLTTALEWLISHNVIRPRDKASLNPKGGRPHSAIYDVNPRLR